MNDDALIQRCQSADSAAFETLINRHYDTIYRFAYRWSGNRENAQDITQITCIKLASSLSQFRFESSFTSWLYRLVINCAKDFYKSPSQHNVREEQHDNLDGLASQTDDKNANRHYARQILEYVDQLQDDLKETLLLVYGSGLSHQQAARRLKVSEGTVSWRLFEARKLLKQNFISSDLDTLPVAEQARGTT